MKPALSYAEFLLQYDVILADCPWFFAGRNQATRFGGGAGHHYPLMRDHELVAMAPEVKALSAENCALFMWASCARLDFAVDLLRAWGFRFATTAFTWIKTKKNNDGLIYGPGNYTASNAEIVLLGLKGSMVPVAKLTPSVVMCPRQGRHSQKPNIYRRIEGMYPGTRKIELFARNKHPGWHTWGNQIGCDVPIPMAEQFQQMRISL